MFTYLRITNVWFHFGVVCIYCGHCMLCYTFYILLCCFFVCCCSVVLFFSVHRKIAVGKSSTEVLYFARSHFIVWTIRFNSILDSISSSIHVFFSAFRIRLFAKDYWLCDIYICIQTYAVVVFLVFVTFFLTQWHSYWNTLCCVSM